MSMLELLEVLVTCLQYSRNPKTNEAHKGPKELLTAIFALCFLQDYLVRLIYARVESLLIYCFLDSMLGFDMENQPWIKSFY